jgi:hypothetical protein
LRRNPDLSGMKDEAARRRGKGEEEKGGRE